MLSKSPLSKSLVSKLPLSKSPFSICVTAPEECLFALRDKSTGDVYPLPGVPSYAAAYFILTSLQDGQDTPLLLPPPRGASLEVVCPPRAAAQAARDFRREERRCTDAERAWQEARAEFERLCPRRPEARLTWAERLACRVRGFLWRTDVTVVVLAVVAVAILGRRLLP